MYFDFRQFMTDAGEALGRTRTWMNEGSGRTVTIAAVSGVLLLGVLLWLMRDPEAGAVEQIREKGRKAMYVCKDCGASGQTRIDYDESFPIRCPQCDKQTAVRGFRCVKCKNTIEDRPEPIFYCPHCNYKYDNTLRPSDAVRPEDAIP